MKKLFFPITLFALAFMATSCGEPSDSITPDKAELTTAVTVHRGDWYNTGTSNYIVRLINKSTDSNGNVSIDRIAVVELNAIAASAGDNSLPSGTYKMSSKGHAAWTMAPGAVSGNAIVSGSYYFLFDDKGAAKKQIFATSGEVNVSRSGEQYIISVSMSGDNEAFEGTFNGAITSGGLKNDYVQLDFAGAHGLFYGDFYGVGCTNWTIFLYDSVYASSSEANPQGQLLYFDALTTGLTTIDEGIAAGTYSIDFLGLGSSFMIFSSMYNNIDSAGSATDTLVDGTVTISRNGSKYTIQGTIFGLANAYKFSYTGTVGTSKGGSSDGTSDDATTGLTADLALALDGASLYYEGIYTDGTTQGAPYWYVELTDSAKKYAIGMFVNTNSSVYSEGIPSGEYNVNENYAAFCIDRGIYEDSQYYGSWLCPSDKDNEYTAAINGGTMTVTNKGGNVYIFAVDFTDPQNHKITGTFEGTASASDISGKAPSYAKSFFGNRAFRKASPVSGRFDISKKALRR